jgi:hypothetical protein
MEYLFTTPETNLLEFLKDLSIDNIRECCDKKIFNRAQEYYEDGLVKNISFNSTNEELSAVVSGNQNYSIKICKDHDEVMASCTCPYDDVCKHIVAVLLKVSDEGIDDVVDTQVADIQIDDYLKGLEKDQLIDLVKQFAPTRFFNEIGNKSVGASDAQKIFKGVEKAIKSAFTDDELLYSPSDFAGVIGGQASRLKGLEKQLKIEIGELILFVIDKVEEAFDDGYLYIDNYYDGDDYFEQPEEFEELVVGYVRSLSHAEKVDFLMKLDDRLTKTNYDAFDCLNQLSKDVFDDNELPKLKELVLSKMETLPENLIDNYYGRIRELLNNDEKEIILKFLAEKNPWRLIELAEFLHSIGKTAKAIARISNYLIDRNLRRGMVDLYCLYLDLLKAENLPVDEVAEDAITSNPNSEVLRKVISINPSKQKYYEDILEKKNSSDLLQYLQQEKRLTDALNLIKRDKSIWHDAVESFYSKHKMVFPDEAGVFFCSIIDKNLQFTGDNYYSEIENALSNISVINPKLSREIANDIRKNYNRRRNLIQLISKY